MRDRIDEITQRQYEYWEAAELYRIWAIAEYRLSDAEERAKQRACDAARRAWNRLCDAKERAAS